MAEEVAKIRGEVPCNDAREFREGGLAERYRSEFDLPCTESLSAGDSITIELLYRSGQVAVLGRGLVVAKAPGGYQVRFTQISLGEVDLATERWDDTVPPTLVPDENFHVAEPEAAIVTTYSTPQRANQADGGARAPRTSPPPAPPKPQGKRKKSLSSAGVVPGAPRRRRTTTTRAPVYIPKPRDTVFRPPPAPEPLDAARKKLIIALASAVVVVVGLTIAVVVVRATRDSGVDSPSALLAAEAPDAAAELRLSDDRLLAGHITGKGDHAVSHLLAAQKLAPTSPAVERRVSAYVDMFEGLAHGAAQQGFADEALRHLEVVLALDPDHAGAKALASELQGRNGGP